MLLEQQITSRTTREINLPYACKEVSFYSTTFIRVNKDESMLRVVVMDLGEHASMTVSKHISSYDRDCIARSVPCEMSEVEEAKNIALDTMEIILSNSLAK